jgi:hypothetical protein
MVRPCVASGFCRTGGKRSCINVSGLKLELFAPDHHGYQRACDLVNGQASTGHLGHQCAHALGRPNLHLVSSSRRPRLETVDRVTSSLAPHIAQFLCSSQWPFLRPGLQSVDRVARRGGQGRPSRLACRGLRRCQAAPLPRRARREDQAGRTLASSVLVSSKARPLASTAQAMRASLLASAMASTLWCNRLLAASIQDLSP